MELAKYIQKRTVENNFSILSELKKAFQPHQDKNGNWYRITVANGYDICHYDSGLLCVQVFSSYQGKNLWAVKFHVGNLDDGSFDAWSTYFETLEQANELRDRIAQAILPDLHVMDINTIESLNEKLKPFKMYGELV